MHSIPLEADGLGTPVGDYRRSWRAAALGWGGSAALWAAALWFSSRSPTGTWWTALIFGAFGLLSLGLLVSSLYAALTERVLIFSDGLFHQRGRSGERFAWRDIKDMEWDLGQHQGMSHLSIRLTRSDGEECELSGSFFYLPKGQQRVGIFQRFSLPETIVHIEEAVRQALCRKAIELYESGATVDFDGIRVHRRGVQTDAGAIDWPMVADIDYHKGEYRFFVHGEETPRLSIAAKAMINGAGFNALLQHIGPNRWRLTTLPDPASEQPFGKEARRRRWQAILPWVGIALVFGLKIGYPKYEYAHSQSGQLEHAMNLYADQRYAESIAVLDPLIVEDPAYVMGYIHRGRARQKLRQFDRALADYQQAIVFKPGYWYAIYNRGRLYDDLDRFDAALRDYAQALALKPDLGYAFYKRGNLYARMGMKQAAIKDLETYLTFPDELGNHAQVEQALAGLRR
ncbi:MAG TPA: tetratricopeptide repeat protein [Herpetosiphonaceae bacterium]|nr:tetratricopeptide repeat protein [Herpetosiphonaceae bacterium]